MGTRMQIDGSTVVLTGILARTLLGILFSVFWLRDKRAVRVPLVERDLLSRLRGGVFISAQSVHLLVFAVRL
jgi:hypothetical protein